MVNDVSTNGTISNAFDTSIAAYGMVAWNQNVRHLKDKNWKIRNSKNRIKYMKNKNLPLDPCRFCTTSNPDCLDLCVPIAHFGLQRLLTIPEGDYFLSPTLWFVQMEYEISPVPCIFCTALIPGGLDFFAPKFDFDL